MSNDQVIDGVVCDFDGYPYVCAECNGEFTVDEWGNRHSNVDGADIHDYCCKICGQLGISHRVEARGKGGINVVGGIDYVLLKQQKEALSNLIDRNYKALHLPEMCSNDLCTATMSPSEYDALEGIDNLLDSIYDMFEPVEHEEEI